MPFNYLIQCLFGSTPKVHTYTYTYSFRTPRPIYHPLNWELIEGPIEQANINMLNEDIGDGSKAYCLSYTWVRRRDKIFSIFRIGGF